MKKVNAPDNELLSLLQNSSLHMLLTITGRIISRLGYGEVQGMGRRSPRQKSWHGGFELLAEREFGGESVKTLIKVLKDELRQRVLSEMAGSVDLRRADVGIIVSPFPAQRLYDLAKHYSRSRLIVWDGPYLCSWCRKFHIGVREDGSIDYAFWADVEDSLEYLDSVTRIKKR